MARVVVSTQARSDAEGIVLDLASKAGVQVAANFDALFSALFDRLAIFPESGVRRPQLGRLVRIGLVQPFVAVYRFSPSTDLVEIVRVLHGRRRISRALLAP